MSTLGERLKKERQRLKMSQTALGDIGGVQKRAQINYESDERSPDAAYLAAIADAGADVQYIVTGIRSDMALTPDERELLALFHSASPSVRAAAVGALRGGGAKISVGGDVGQFSEGDITNRGGVRIRMGKK